MPVSAAVIAHLFLTDSTGSDPLEITDADNQTIYDADNAVILSEP